VNVIGKDCLEEKVLVKSGKKPRKIGVIEDITLPGAPTKLPWYKHKQSVDGHRLLSKRVVPRSKRTLSDGDDQTVILVLQLHSDPNSPKDRKNEVGSIMSHLFDTGFKSLPDGLMRRHLKMVGNVILTLDNPEMDKPERVIALRSVDSRSSMIVWNSEKYCWEVKGANFKHLPGNTIMFMAQAPIVKKPKVKDLDDEF
jgi:hypothetical protein